MSHSMSRIRGPGRSWWPALPLTLGLLACAPTTQEETITTEPEVPSLYLELVSLEGDAVPEALVRLPSGQRQQADARGTLLLEQLPVGSQSLAVQADGYYPTLLVFDMAEGVRAGARLALFPLGTHLATFDASQGTTLTQGGITLTVPPGALLDARGNLIQGQVDVFLTVLDLKGGELVAAPGVLEGIPARGADPVGLESLGMVALVFRQLGEVVPFARGIRIRGSSPGSIRVGSQGGPGSPLRTWREALSECPLPRVPGWRLDPDTGRWLPTGELGQLVASGTEGLLQWELTLDNPPTLLNVALPFWWCSPSASPDNPLQVPTPAWVETACLEVRVEDTRGQPVAGRMVVARGTVGLGSSASRALTDADGRARLEVKRNQTVEVDAGAGATPVSTGMGASNCRGQGVEPTSVTLTVPVRTCTPGAALEGAYTGPENTLGQGICRAVRRFCDAQGTSWRNPYVPMVLPQEERCDNTLDDDCDGETNETCASICQPGMTRSCYDGPPGTRGVGLCRAGTRTCNDSGTAWSTCTGQLTPQAEDCATLVDDDCDGQLNEASACVWAATGSMAQPRYAHTATLLNTGKVLIAGGSNSSSLQTAELYDPASNIWSPAASMASPHSWHTATLLKDGMVLVSGEYRPELYDPTSNSWSPAGLMALPRSAHTATLLNTGKVLVAGGFNGRPERTAELYDPTSNSWSPAASMADAREYPTATLLNTGKVLVAGGNDDGGSTLATAELYDPTSNSWPPTGLMASPRVEHTATLLNTGKVLVAGGWSNGSPARTAELYDPTSNSWSPAGSMASPRHRHTATLLNDGRVLVTGAADAPSGQTAEVYDPTSNTWAPALAMTSPRGRHTATLLPNGRVLVVGGAASTTVHSTVELYSP